MATPLQTDLQTFGSGFVVDRDTVWFTVQIDALLEQGSAASSILRLVLPTSKWSSRHLRWTAIRLSITPGPHVNALGPGGEFLSFAPGVPATDELIDDGPEGVKFRGPMRDLRFIGNHLYAAGMSRQVYRREGPGRWSRADAGTVQPLGDLTVAGFNAIDGLSEDDFYGVGFGGEIWRRRKGKWKQLDSPTNVVLSRVRVVNPELAYAVGQRGVLLRGAGDTWEVVDHQSTEEDLWSVEWFHDELYVASDRAVYRLTASGSLQEVDMGLGDDRTYYDLHANDGVLWSIGPKHLSWTDGTRWNDGDV